MRSLDFERKLAKRLNFLGWKGNPSRPCLFEDHGFSGMLYLSKLDGFKCLVCGKILKIKQLKEYLWKYLEKNKTEN